MATGPSEGEKGGTWGTRGAAEAWQRGEATRAQSFGAATERMLDLAGVVVGSRVLDVAAGSGDQTLAAARRVGPRGSVLATDISASMLELAADGAREAGLTNVETRVMDARELDLEPGSFDAAISRYGLMLIPEPQRVLDGIRRALKRGGKLAAMVFSSAEKNPFLARPVAIARRRGGLPEPPPGQPGMFALGDPGVLGETLRAAGFRDVAVHGVSIPRQFASAAEALRFQQESLLLIRQVMDQLGEAERRLAWAEVEDELRRAEGPDGFEMLGESLIGVGTR